MREINSTAHAVFGKKCPRLWPEWVAAVVGVVCYLNTLPNDFCYDDVAVVQVNAKVNEPGQWGSIWTTDYWSQAAESSPHRDLLYRPLAVSSYRAVRIVFGPSPFPQRMVNLLLYAGVCAMIARLGRRVGFSDQQAFSAATLFAVLPIHTEVVCSIVGRADLLAAIGVLIAILAHRRSTLGESSGAKVGWGVLAAMALFAAVASKESAIGGVLIVALFDAWWARTDSHARVPQDGPVGRGTMLGLNSLRRILYLIVPIVLYLILRSQALGVHLHQQPAPSKTVNVLVDAPVWQHALGVMQLWGMYWAKTYWPAVLSIGYSVNAVRLATSLFDGHVILGLVMTLGLAILSTVALRKKRGIVIVLVAAVVVSYAPTSNAFVLLQVFFAERVWFFPSVWVAMLLGFYLGPILRKRIGITVGLLIVGALFGRCWLRESDWRNNGELFSAAYRDMPHSISVSHLYGQWLVENGESSRGIELLRRAVEMDLGYTDAHRALGRSYWKAGDLGRAMHHLQIANMQVPHHPPTVELLDRAKDAWSNVHVEELHRLEEAARRDPGDLQRELMVVRKMRDLGDLEGAISRLAETEGQFQHRADWQAEYAVTTVYANRIDEAIEHYREALRLEARESRWAVELAMLLLERRNGDDLDHAWQWAIHASSLAPSDPAVLVCQAELLAFRGDLTGAIARYRQAIQLLPRDNGQRNVYEQRLKVLGG
ncbi:MAG: hypothetical protein AABZ47_08855 [Planctomycetota bacterium]